MKDVASLAGVATKTVSRVINGEPTVAPEFAIRVHEAAPSRTRPGSGGSRS